MSQHIVTITLPGSFSFRFICDPLHTAAAACISTHLLVPLLGISSSLLSMVKEEDTKALSEAVDASAKAKRLKEGRATRIFFDVGATAMGRWVQAHKGVKERDRSASFSLSHSKLHDTYLLVCAYSPNHACQTYFSNAFSPHHDQSTSNPTQTASFQAHDSTTTA